MRSRAVLAAATALAAALVAVPSAGAAKGLLVGLYDEPETLGNAGKAFPLMRTLRSQVVRVNLYWGSGYGRTGTGLGVAKRRPTDATNPDDRAYDWSLYDRTIRAAVRHRMKVVLAIYGTPGWANRGNGPKRAAGADGRPARLRLRRRDALQRQLRPERRRSRCRSRCLPCGTGWPGTSRTIRSSCARSTAAWPDGG